VASLIRIIIVYVYIYIYIFYHSDVIMFMLIFSSWLFEIRASRDLY
jgi:hypothetical protein